MRTTIIALMTIIFFLLYIITDTIELLQSGLTPFQMILTYISMAGIPFAVMGLYITDAQKGGILYLSGALLISISFIYFSGTATYAFAENIHDYAQVVSKLGFMYLFHGILLVVGGILFSTAIIRSRLAHPFIAYGILAGSLLSLITGAFQLSEQFYVIANFIRNGFFVYFGIWILVNKTKYNV